MSNNKKKSNAWIVLLAMLAGMVLGIIFASTQERIRWSRVDDPRTVLFYKMRKALDLLDQQYVDSVNFDTMSGPIMNAVLGVFDPHSYYSTVEDASRQEEEMRGNFEGIGVTIRKLGDTLYVGQLLPGSPAGSKGIVPGDIIMTVGHDTTTGVGMPSNDAVSLIRGPRGTQVDMGICHRNSTAITHYLVPRKTISTPSLGYSGMLDQQTGYISISHFGITTYNEFYEALSNLKSRGMKQLILDLRSNPGGLLDAAIRIADDFLPKGDTIVYTQGAHLRKQVVRAHSGGLFEEGPLVVMLNEYSASASEVVAGAIQDNDRGTIVGRRSFGKGLVQQQIHMPDGSSIALTVARYYTPAGRCIQRPYDRGTDEYYTEFLEQVLSTAMGDSIVSRVTDSTQYRTKKGRVVYGGGGIYPDRVLPLVQDTDIYYFNIVNNKGYVDRIAFEYVANEYRKLHRMYATEDDFVKRFTLPETLLEQVIQEAEKDGVPRDKRCLAKHGQRLRMMLKARIGESAYSNDVFYRIYLSYDEEVMKARKEFDKK